MTLPPSPLPPPSYKKNFLYLSKPAHKIAFAIFLQMELSSSKKKNSSYFPYCV